MSFAGLKKQFNKANQYMTEKIGGAECTKLDDDFVEMERKTDVTFELVDDLQLKTKEYLQPNPTARAKMAAVKGISKLSGQAKASTYPQPEGVLGECMLTFGKRLGEESVYAAALVEAGESFRMMADVKYTLDDNVKQNFLEPLHQLQTKDLKEVMHHRKKLQGRRLDFDCKKRRQTKGNANFKNSRGSPVPIQGQGQGGNNDFWPLTLGQSASSSCLSPDDEIKQAEDKFAESLHLAQMGMYNLLENDTEQVSQLTSFAECLLDYHKQCTEIIEALVVTLQEKKQEADEKPRKEFVPKTVHDLQLHLDTDMDLDHKDHSLSGTTPQRSPMASPSQRPADQTWFPGVGPNHNNQMSKSNCASPAESPMKSSPARTPSGPSCKALYDFDAENPGELGFKEGQTIHLTSRIDDNWYEGTVDGRSGYFPVTYVQITVPLP